MKICRSTLFEAGRSLFVKNWKIYIRGKQAWFWQLKLYFKSFRCLCRTYGRWQVSRKTVTKSLAAYDSRRLHDENHLRFSNSKHFRFYWTKKHFISEWYFTKNHESGSLVVWKVKTAWDSRQNRELGPASLGSRGAIADLFGVIFIAWTSQKASKVHELLPQSGHSSYLKHSKSTCRQSSCDSCEVYKISTSRNGNDLRQLSFWYRALSCGADWFTKGVYIWVTNLHILVPTITCSLRYA